MVEDDEIASELLLRERALLRELHGIEAELGEVNRARPQGLVGAVARKAYHAKRDLLVARKGRAVARYRAVKEELRDRRLELRRAARDVERDLTDATELIRELLNACRQYGAYESEYYQGVMDAAQRWVGE